MIYKDIVTKRTYTQNGEEKTKWFNVGTLKVTDEGKGVYRVKYVSEYAVLCV